MTITSDEVRVTGLTAAGSFVTIVRHHYLVTIIRHFS